MSKSADHLLKADANRDLADRFATAFADDPAWAVVIRFYAALHYLDGYLADKGEQADTHGKRKALIRSRPELSRGRGRAFRVSYSWLQNQSEQIRYDAGFRASENIVAQSAEKLKLVEKYLRPKLVGSEN